MPKTRKSTKRLSSQRQRSILGQIKVPMDVRNNNNINSALNKIANSKITVILIYADWCGHCKTYEPFFNRAANVPGAPSTIKLNEQMVQTMNNTMSKKLPLSTPIDVDGFPTVIAVNNRGQRITELPIVREDEPNAKMMEAIPQIADNMPEDIERQLNSIKNNRSVKTQNIPSRVTPEDLSVYPMSVASSKEEYNKNLNLVTPPTPASDIEAQMTPQVAPVQKQSGGLYGALVEASYHLAPAGVLAGLYHGIKKSKHRSTRTRKTSRSKR